LSYIAGFVLFFVLGFYMQKKHDEETRNRTFKKIFWSGFIAMLLPSIVLAFIPNLDFDQKSMVWAAIAAACLISPIRRMFQAPFFESIRAILNWRMRDTKPNYVLNGNYAPITKETTSEI
jgi:hypothetical protein